MDWRIRLAVEAMSREIAQPMSVGELARRVNLSRSRFTYLFRNELGCSPGAYFRNLRLDYARLLVERSFQSLKEIMVRVGFTDTGHFVRDFKRRHGATPGTLRPRSPDSCSPRRTADEQHASPT